MAQWSNNDDAGNSVNWGARFIFAGSGPANEAANNTALFKNTTPDAFKTGEVIGQFPITVTEMANNTTERKGVTHAGWALRHAGEGPLLSVSAANGSGFANGETVLVSNGTVNAVVTLTSNVTGNLALGTVTTPGQFVNTAVLAYTFQRQEHITKFVATAGKQVGTGNVNITGTATGYSNNDVLTVTNGQYGVINAVANVATNATGGTLTFTFSNTGLFPPATTNTQLAITIANNSGGASNGSGATFNSANLVAAVIIGYSNTDILLAGNGISNGTGNLTTNATGGTISNMNVITVGLFSNVATNNSVNVIVRAANGAVSNGFGAFFSANLGTSTGGTVDTPTLGGRAGRFSYETLVAMSSCGGSGTFVGN